ncbi:DeoR family transcriptional regulator [Chromatiales bacterium (ex Bugula neritina AB1)]|nr:DeoR family transcriptional regulator [Chromatiales bacterium (ex Bugula neritina AB1)]
MATPPGCGLNSRQQVILDHVRNNGEVQVDSLSDVMEVTPQTIRRDLNLMCDMRLLQRVHGGAVLHDGVSNMGYEARKRFMAEEKELIARAAAQLVPEDSSLFANIGTTTEAVIRELSSHRGLLVVTNNANIVEILRPNMAATIMLAGGKVRNEDGGIVGELTAEYMGQYKLDHAVIGVSSLERDGTLLDFDTQEVSVAKAIIQNSRSTILVADSSKFERSAPIRIGNVSQVDYVVTDRSPPNEFIEHCQRSGVELIIAG